jgi:phosphatidylglycerol:prolipoprotein diacylglycerol transferase
MYPIIKFGNLVIPTYGVIALFTFLFTLWLIKFYAIKDNFDYRKARDVYLYAACAALVGAKLLAIITEMPLIVENPRYIWRILITGGVFYGGLFAGILCIVLYSHFQKINLFLLLDMLFPMVALSMAIDRWGCFASGCCFGKPTTVAWGVKFTNETAFKLHADLPSVPVHPTQIYLSLNSLIIFIILTFMYRQKKFHGQILFSYLILYAIGRFFIEYYRFDFRGIMLGGYLSTSQLIALASLILSLVGLVYFSHKAKKATKSQQ